MKAKVKSGHAKIHFADDQKFHLNKITRMKSQSQNLNKAAVDLQFDDSIHKGTYQLRLGKKKAKNSC